jgi:hypothetical protein
MNENDATRAFQVLAEALSASQFSWLLDEVLAEIRRGKPKEKRVRVGEASEFVLVTDELEPARGRSATFVESIEYTPSERLEILLSALERGVVAPISMEEEIANTLLEMTKQPTTAGAAAIFKFVDEGDGGGSRESNQQDRQKRAALGRDLARSLTQCKNAIHAAE